MSKRCELCIGDEVEAAVGLVEYMTQTGPFEIAVCADCGQALEGGKVATVEKADRVVADPARRREVGW